jgi:UDP-N-acetylmuramyl pentapeptide phosphotransferase/UDP-N-acetylglucosamine-1-phosphate transferase
MSFMSASLVLIMQVLAAAALCHGLCRVLMPLLQRYALARPNARSSHVVPTPQGGGIAILIAMLVVCAFAVHSGVLVLSEPLIVLAAATVMLALIGGWDDIAPLPASLRLGLQGLAVGAVVLALPPLDLMPVLPPMAEGALVILAGIWFVNLTNFMDGLDWLTVAGFLPMTALIAVLGMAHQTPPDAAMVAAALCGALIGFAPFNRPVARLFLGDVGSLPIGLITAFLLYAVTGQSGLAAAILLPLYHVSDATLMLVQRLVRRERIWESHRGHAYQRATSNGFSVRAVALHVLGLNCALAMLALICVLVRSTPVHLACLASGLALTLLLIRHFGTPHGASGDTGTAI